MTSSGGIEVAFGLGSNVGDKVGNVRRALLALEAAGLATGIAASSLYRTEPWGPVAQDWFVNGCCVGETSLDPASLLRRVKALETALGRVETVRWGPRVIDIDILYYGDRTVSTDTLTLPHAELLRRAFVLVPLAELRPDRRIGDVTVGDAAARCARDEVRRLDDIGS